MKFRHGGGGYQKWSKKFRRLLWTAIHEVNDKLTKPLQTCNVGKIIEWLSIVAYVWQIFHSTYVKNKISEWRRGLTCNFSCFNLDIFLEILSEFFKRIIFLSIFLSIRTIFSKFSLCGFTNTTPSFFKNNFQKRNALKYCLPVFLGIHKIPKQKYFLKSCECLI